MRFALLAGLVCLTAVSRADRLLTIPTARKIPFGTIRFEYRADPSWEGQQELLTGIGISTAFDMEVRTDQSPWTRSTTTFDLGYNYIAAIPGLSPGISVGVQDAENVTPDGRRFYLATTFRETFSTMNGDYPADITLGVFATRSTVPFVGVQIPFSRELHLLAESNGIRISVGGEFRPISWLNLRAQIIGQTTELGLQMTMHF